MELYFTTRNTGPSHSSDPLYLLYMGLSLDDAIQAVGGMQQYEYSIDEFKFNERYPYLYTALPRNIEPEFIKFYAADGWWSSIVKVVFE